MTCEKSLNQLFLEIVGIFHIDYTSLFSMLFGMRALNNARKWIYLPFFQVKYSIVQQPNQKGTKFTVDEETGEVSTNKVFDREGDDGKFVSVTVKATDQGEPSLEGVCSFTGI